MSEIIRHSSSSVGKGDFTYINKLAQDNYVGHGPLSRALESRLAERFSRASVIMTGSGEAALALALHQLRSCNPDKDEVVVSAYVCAAVVNAVLSLDLRPVFADVEPDSLNLGVKDVQATRLTAKTLAIICTHMGGYPDDINAAMQLGVPVISDCAQAIGASIEGRQLISLGDVAITSFGPTKFLTAGLGGAVFCDARSAKAIRRMATAELSVDDYQEHGFVRTQGQHFSDLNAGLGLSQLERLERFLQKRRLLAKKYDKVLKGVRGISFPKKTFGAEPNWFRYYFLTDRAAEWQRHLLAKGIDARTSISHVITDYFPQEAKRVELAKQSKRVVSLPIYPELDAVQITRVLGALQSVAVEITEAV
jgi:dTDP-4-amino-4,6-dideoxygalactose transaminase